jgi:hypothetical protein
MSSTLAGTKMVAPQVHDIHTAIVAMWARRQGTAAAMREIEAVEFLAKLGHRMAMVRARGYGCHWGSRFPMTHRGGAAARKG